MFRSLRLPTLAISFFLSLLFALPAAAQGREMVSIARAEVNMRNAPNTRSEVLWGLGRGYPLSVVGRRGNWVQVADFENDRGWVLRSLTDKTPHHIVKARVANLRGTPNTRARVVGKLQYGDVLRTLERRGEWVNVRSESGATGWVSRPLLWGW